jgi:hypothetical protein
MKTKYKKISFRLVTLVFFALIATVGAWGQTTIVSDGLNNSTTTFTLSGGAYYTGSTDNNDEPANSPFAFEGTHSRGLSNGTATLTSGNINTIGYANVTMELRTAAFGISAGGTAGMEAADYIRVEVSPNGGTNYYNTVTITGRNNDTYWAYSATGVASTAYDGDINTVTFTPAGTGNRTTDGYSTIRISDLPSSTNLRIRITLVNNDNTERWCVDDFNVSGNRVYYSNGNNPVNLTTSWWTNTNGTGSNPSDFTSGDIFIVQSGHNMTTTNTWSVNGIDSKVQISNNASITETNNITLSANTTLQIDNGGTLNHNVNSTTIFGGTESFDITSNVNYGRGGAQAVVGTDYGNLIISGSGDKTSATAAFTVASNLSVNSGNLILQATNADYTVGGNLTVNTGATLTHSVSWDLAGRLLSVGGNMSIAGAYNYSAAGRAHIQMTGLGTRDITTGTSGLSILTLQNGDFRAIGPVTVNDNFWAMFGTAGSFSTNGQTVTANAAMLVNGGTVNINGGTLNVTGGMRVGINNGLDGTVNFSAGTLNTDGLTLGDGNRNGTFSHSGGTANINGNLLINPSCSYTCTNSPLINLSGNFTNNGTFSSATETVTFSGTTLQTLGGSSNTTFNNLTVNNSNGVNLGASVTVKGLLTLTNGNLGLVNNDLTISNPIAGGTFSNTRMIVTDGTGSLIKQGTTNANFQIVYPVGTGTSYTPVQITSLSSSSITGTGTFAVRSVAAVAPGIPGNNSLIRHWVTSSTNINSPVANIRFSYVNGDVNASASASEYVFMYNAGFWTVPGGASPTGSNPLISSAATNLNATWSATVYDKYTVPPGITTIKVECWGAGGGGSSIAATGVRGGGGGGGAYAKSILTVIPGNTYYFIKGTGGSANSQGGNSSFGSNLVVAAGGNGGTFDSNIGGTGGSVAASIGTVTYAGGNGANGGATWSGGGGGGAGTTGAGGNASGATAGTGTSQNGGNGGAGRSGSSDGLTGANYGGGGSGACTNDGTDRNGGSGANGQVLISLPSQSLLSSNTQISSSNVYQGSVKLPLFSFETAITVSEANLTGITFNTSGTCIASDITRFQLWYNTTNNLATATKVGSDITTSLGAGAHSLSVFYQPTPAGSTGYFWITADLAITATPNATLSVNAISPSDLTYELGSVTGSTTAGGTQTIMPVPRVALATASPAVAVADVNQGTKNHPIYKFTTAVTWVNATLNSVSFTTGGSYAATDVLNFKLWYNTSDNLATASQVGSPIIGSLGTGSHTFSGFNLTTVTGTTGYFWITTDVAPFPNNGRTINVSAITSANLAYSSPIFFSGTPDVGGSQTIQTQTGVFITSTYPAVSANSVLQGSVNQNVYKFSTIVSGAAVTLNSVTFATTGSYAAVDITNFKLYYNTVNSFVGATQIGTTMTSGLGVGTHTFSGLGRGTNANTIAYFWITADIASGATPGRTITVSPVTTTDLVYSGTPVKNGSTYSGGIQTIQLKIDTDGDGVADLYDLDDDNDGIPDIDENESCNTTVAELFPNSNFDAGNTGFSSGYGYVTIVNQNSLHPEGIYAITPNANLGHESFADCSSGHGNMMVVNGSPNPNLIVWSSGTIPVTPYTDYTLTINLTSVNPSNPAQLIFNVNGENIGLQFNATTTNCQWVPGVAIWNSGSNTSATFDIMNLNLIAGGNDFAIDDVSCKYKVNCDYDGDGIPDKLDLDSDNDGIYDVVEAGGAAIATGTINGFADADQDGLSDNVDNLNPGTGYGAYIGGTKLPNPDTDGDLIPDRADTDSDNDFCPDTKEAGMPDPDLDGKLGNSPVTIDARGRVTSAAGYTGTKDINGDGVKDYVQKIPYITTQPADQTLCLPSGGATFSLTATNTGGTYQWQVSTDNGATWNNIADGGVYSGTSGNGAGNLTISNAVTTAYDGYMYRILLTNNAYNCSPLASSAGLLKVYAGVPPVPGAISGYATVCSSISQTYSVPAIPSATSYNWSVPTGWTITSGTGTNSIAVSTGVAGGTISVTATNFCGTSVSASTLGVTISAPTPTFTVPAAGTTICQSADITYTTQAGKSNYTWNIGGSLGIDYIITSGGTTADNSVTLKWLTTGNKTVTVNYTSGGCAGLTPASVSVTVNPNAMIMTQPVAPSPTCAGTGSISLSITATGATGYQWQVSTDGGTSWSNLVNDATYNNVTTATMTITNPPASFNNNRYRCEVTGSCGAATSFAVPLTVNQNTITLSSAVGTNAQTKCINTAITNITYNTTGATGATFSGLPTGVSGNWAANVVTISGTPSVAGTHNYTVTLTGGCGTITATGSIIVTANNTITLSSAAGTNAQTKCINTAITNITYNTTGATGATFSGLPTGVTGNWAGNVVTISGTPTVAGTNNYTVTLTGGCGTITATGSITVTANNTITLSSAAGTNVQTKCINTAITNITYNTTGATGATFSGLPTGVTGNWVGNVVTISGTPSVAGTHNYTVTLTGGCGTITATGSITVTANNTITLSSAAGTDAQSKCINTAIINITYNTTGATGATFSGLPTGVTGNWAGNVVTISGTPTVAGTNNYTVTLTGGCGTITATGSITVTANNTITLSSAAGTDAQTKCINTAITNITYNTTGATGATFSGLPTGVTGNWAGNVVTISGTPSVAGTHNYTVTLTGGCGTITATGSITVTANNTITLSSAAGTNAQTKCINTAITNITYNTTGATGATFSGLPTGVTGNWAGNVVTISGIPTVAGTNNYTVTLTGGCGTITATGSITVTANNTITLSSAAGTNAQTKCINTPITDITYNTTGATGATFSGLPTGVTGNWAGNVVTISGTPTVAGTNNYTVTLTGGCGAITATGSITVTANNTITLSSAAGTNAQTKCINTAITNITYNTTGATGATFSGLPTGVTGNWAGNVVTISGTPTLAGTHNYIVTLTGGCGTITATGSIIVTANNTITLSSAAGTDVQTKCINTAITNITYNTTGATGATFSGLPTGVTGNWAGNVVTISGTPTVAGTNNYTVTLTGGCGTITATGSITVTANNTITLSSAAGTDAQTKCINTAITNITYNTTGATGATFSGLLTGVTGNWAGNVVTISGTPSVAGTNNYTVTLTGGCGTITATGSITVNNLPVVTISISETSGIASNDGTICNGDPVSLTASGGSSYSWSPATGLSATNIASPNATPSSTTTYTVTVTDANSCVNTASRLITVVPKPNTGEFYHKPNN